MDIICEWNANMPVEFVVDIAQGKYSLEVVAHILNEHSRER